LEVAPMNNVFEESVSRLTQNESDFSDNIRDAFGQSITSDVFEPVLREFIGLGKMLDRASVQEKVIDALTFELNLII
jgi:hypothetical protein